MGRFVAFSSLVVLLYYSRHTSSFLTSPRRRIRSTSWRLIAQSSTSPVDDLSEPPPPELPRPEVLRVLKEAIADNIAADAAALQEEMGYNGTDAATSPAAAVLKPPNKSTRRKGNAEGLFYVTEGCINCGTCRWMAPETFGVHGFKAAVAHQPAEASEVESEAEQATSSSDGSALRRAVRAMVTCPSGSIRTASPVGGLACSLGGAAARGHARALV